MLIKEIGSEFWNVPVGVEDNRIFPEHTQWYLSGRIALKAILKDLDGVKTLAMPSWCCESMVKPFVDAGIQVFYYPVYMQNDRLVQEINLQCDVVYLMNYFGYSCDEPIDHPCIIRDVTHSIFSAEYSDADYYFGSLRKWCGVWTGGFAWTKDGYRLPMENNDDKGYIELRKKAMEAKRLYINSNREEKSVEKKCYLDIYAQAEELLNNCDIAPSSDRDINVARKLDIGFICNRRRSNARILMDAFREQLIFPILKDTDCPMFVPILIPDGKRDELRSYLVKHKIYCPIHWPISRYHKLNEREMDVYKNVLSLVCDQRYSQEDMMRIIETIISFWREG